MTSFGMDSGLTQTQAFPYFLIYLINAYLEPNILIHLSPPISNNNLQISINLEWIFT